MRRAALIVGLLLASTAAAQPRKPGKGFQPPKASPALTVYPTVNNGLPAIGANECPTGVTLLGSRGEAVTFSAAGAGRHCTRTDGGLVSLAANEPAVSGAAVKVRASVQNVLKYSEDLSITGAGNWLKPGVSGDGGTMAAPVVEASDGGEEFDAPDLTNTATKITFPTTGWPGDVSYVTMGFTGTAVPWSQGIYLRTASGTAEANLQFTTGAAWTTATRCSATTAWGTPCKAEAQTLTASASWVFSLGSDLRAGSGQTGITGATIYAWGAQAQIGSTLSDYCGPTTTAAVTCAAEVATVANPLAAAAPANPTQWGYGARVDPGGRAWTSTAANQGVVSLGTLAAADSSFIQVTTAGVVSFRVYDTSGGVKTVATDAAISSGAHDIYGFSDNGTLAVWVDGYKPAQTVSGAGTGIITTQPATVYIGSSGTGNQMGGSVSNLRVIRGVSPP